MTNRQYEERVSLGASDLRISPLGIGVWAWGGRMYWGYGTDYTKSDVQAAFETCLAARINFFDTAEIYGQGHSERLLGQLIGASNQPVVTATKFFPYPWRLRKASLRRALQASLRRLGMVRVGLYQIHWPFPPVPIETWMAALTDAIEAGLIQTAGVSNYNAGQTRRAHTVLGARGIPLVSNQVPFSLLDRRIERNGLLETCRELGVTVIVYSPLAQGTLTGKYTPDNPPSGIRGRRFRRERLAQIQPLVGLLREIGEAHGSKTPSQVALNWVMRKGTVPIPGVKNARQAEENIGALGWRLADDEIAVLDAASEGL